MCPRSWYARSFFWTLVAPNFVCGGAAPLHFLCGHTNHEFTTQDVRLLATPEVFTVDCAVTVHCQSTTTYVNETPNPDMKSDMLFCQMFLTLTAVHHSFSSWVDGHESVGKISLVFHGTVRSNSDLEGCLQGRRFVYAVAAYCCLVFDFPEARTAILTPRLTKVKRLFFHQASFRVHRNVLASRCQLFGVAEEHHIDDYVMAYVCGWTSMRP